MSDPYPWGGLSVCPTEGLQEAGQRGTVGVQRTGQPKPQPGLGPLVVPGRRRIGTKGSVPSRIQPCGEKPCLWNDEVEIEVLMRAVQADEATDPAARAVENTERLMRRLLRGDEEAFDAFADEYIPRLLRFARSRLSGPNRADLAQDLVQTTMCKALSKIESFRGDASLFSWLCAVCLNEIRMHYRRAENRTQKQNDDVLLEFPADPGSSWGPDPALRAIATDRSRSVHETLNRLPSHYADALEWKYVERWTTARIAEELGCGIKAAESQLVRARRAFRKEYGHVRGVSDRASGSMSATRKRQ